MKRTLVVLADILAVIFSFFIPYIISIMPTNIGECYFFKHGILCPTCGATRCVYNFFTGNFIAAMHYNLVIFCGIIYALVLLVVLNIHIFKKNRYTSAILKFMISPKTIIVLVLFYIGYGLLRNIT